MKVLVSHVQLFATPWTEDRQTPLSMGFPRQEYWSGLPCPSPGDPPNPGIEPRSSALQEVLYYLSHQGSALGLLRIVLNLLFLLSLVAQLIKNPPGCGRPGFDPWVRKIPWRRAWQPTPVAWRIPKDRGTWWAAVHEIAKSRTRLSA